MLGIQLELKERSLGWWGKWEDSKCSSQASFKPVIKFHHRHGYRCWGTCLLTGSLDTHTQYNNTHIFRWTLLKPPLFTSQPFMQVNFSEGGPGSNSTGSEVASMSSQLPDTPNSMVASPIEAWGTFIQMYFFFPVGESGKLCWTPKQKSI